LWAALAGLIFASVDPVLGGSKAAETVRLVIGALLLAEGLALVMTGLRRAVVGRLLTRYGRGPIWRHLVGPIVLGLAFAFVAIGVLELLRGAQGLV
jgi:hypothetical protein